MLKIERIIFYLIALLLNIEVVKSQGECDSKYCFFLSNDYISNKESIYSSESKGVLVINYNYFSNQINHYVNYQDTSRFILKDFL